MAASLVIMSGRPITPRADFGALRPMPVSTRGAAGRHLSAADENTPDAAACVPM